MKRIPTWQYDEFKHCGVDYDDQALAEAYDEQHARFRGNLAAEADRLLDELDVQPDQTLIDVGCGTGFFAVQAAKRCRRVFAVDVSPVMLQVARRKAQAAKVANIDFRHGGFLTYDHADAPVDIITSTAALHHLPDFWKLIGLRRLSGMLKDGGLFYLMDVVYSFTPDEYAGFFDEKVTITSRQVGESFGKEVVITIRDEYPTWKWVMESLLTRAGFTIEHAQYPDKMLARYWCQKLK